MAAGKREGPSGILVVFCFFTQVLVTQMCSFGGSSLSRAVKISIFFQMCKSIPDFKYRNSYKFGEKYTISSCIDDRSGDFFFTTIQCLKMYLAPLMPKSIYMCVIVPLVQKFKL